MTTNDAALLISVSPTATEVAKDRARGQLMSGSWVRLKDGRTGCVTNSDEWNMTVAIMPREGETDVSFMRFISTLEGDDFTPTTCSENRAMHLLWEHDKIEYHAERERHLARCVPV